MGDEGSVGKLERKKKTGTVGIIKKPDHQVQKRIHGSLEVTHTR